MTALDSKTSAELKKMLNGVAELGALLESTLDRSLTDRYIDVNQFIRRYNHFRNDLFSLLPDEDISEIMTDMSLYVYTGDDAIDIAAVKQLLVEVYLKNSQLMAYLQNLLELN